MVFDRKSAQRIIAIPFSDLKRFWWYRTLEKF